MFVNPLRVTGYFYGSFRVLEFSFQPAVVAMNVRHVTDQTALPIFTAVFHQCFWKSAFVRSPINATES